MTKLKYVVLALALTMVGCTTVPLATQARLAAVSRQSLQELDAQQIRVRVAIPQGFSLDVPRTLLTLTFIDGSDRTASYEFHLVQLQQLNETRPGGWFHTHYPVVVNELSLDDKSLETLRLLQREDLAGRKRRGLTLNVESQVSTVPEGASSVRIWVDLRLKQSDSYITLFDGVEVNF
jgi:hypothetical protein